MKKIFLVLVLFLSLFMINTQFSFAQTYEKSDLQKSGNLENTVYKVTIYDANKNEFKDFLANYLMNNDYNIDYSNDYQISATKQTGTWMHAFVGDYKFTFNFSQNTKNIQFIGKGEPGLQNILSDLMVNAINNYKNEK